MRCSLNEDKGIREFRRLAGALPLYRFVLLLQNTLDEINHFFKTDDLPDNLVVFPNQKEVASFYLEAHLLINLSPPTEWTASCDQALLEAMSYGLPVIAPAIGAHGSLNSKGPTVRGLGKQVFKSLEAEITAIIESPSQYAQLSSESLSYIKTLKKNIFSAEAQALKT
jgi:glycosyltransferase involved in cell wall biosynthesis